MLGDMSGVKILVKGDIVLCKYEVFIVWGLGCGLVEL